MTMTGQMMTIGEKTSVSDFWGLRHDDERGR